MKSVVFCTFLFACCLPSLGKEPSPVQSALPMVGTDAHGHVYPGATVPFGMVQLSPDTRLETWDGCSGYHYSDKAILGFSHTHLSGTGCGDLGDIRITPLSGNSPTEGERRLPPPVLALQRNGAARLLQRLLDDTKIKAELTATAHAGLHRYTFPADKPAHLVLDLARGISNQAVEGSCRDESTTVLHGYRRSHGWAADKTFYFVAKFSRPCDRLETEATAVLSRKASGSKAKQVIAHVHFPPSDEPLLVKVGISAVSVEAARKNLDAEIPGWDFDGTVAAAEKPWADYLGRIEIQTADPATRETFYTALYHAAMAPTLVQRRGRRLPRAGPQGPRRPKVFRTTAPSRSGTSSGPNCRS